MDRIGFVEGAPPGESYVEVMNLPSGCFFLGNDGLCSIHREDGRDAKPQVCKAFPFNDYYLSENTLIVAPNALCPLEVHHGDPTAEVVWHQELRADIERYEKEILAAAAGRQRARMSEAHTPTLWREFSVADLEFEAWARDLGQDAGLDGVDLWLRHASRGEAPARTARPELRRRLQRVVDFVGDGAGVEDAFRFAASDEALRAYLPTLRLQAHIDYATLGAPLIERRLPLTFALVGFFWHQAQSIGHVAPDLSNLARIARAYLWPSFMLAGLYEPISVAQAEISVVDDARVLRVMEYLDAHVESGVGTLADVLHRMKIHRTAEIFHTLRGLQASLPWLRFGDDQSGRAALAPPVPPVHSERNAS